MNKKNLFSLARQISLALIVMLGTYMFFAILDNDGGIDGLMGLFILQPIIGLMISSLSIFICLIIGLPIRLNAKLNAWWRQNRNFSIYSLVLAFVLLFLSLLPIFMDSVSVPENPNGFKEIPNKIMSISGWFIMGFSLVHFYREPKV